MFWLKKAKATIENLEQTEICRLEAEALYRSGKYHCAEAVMEAIRKHYAPDVPESVVGTVSGFGGGSSSGCICGAVSGGTVALGLVLADKKKTTKGTSYVVQGVYGGHVAKSSAPTTTKAFAWCRPARLPGLGTARKLTTDFTVKSWCSDVNSADYRSLPYQPTSSENLMKGTASMFICPLGPS
jgi:hypothetical protein